MKKECIECNKPLFDQNTPDDCDLCDECYAAQEAYERDLDEELLELDRAGRTDTIAKIPMLRQWLNEDKITDVNKMVTNKQIRYWLIGEE